MPIFIKKLLHLIKPQDRGWLFGMLLLFLMGTGMEVLGVGLLVPFIAMITDSTFVEKNEYAQMLYQTLELESYRSFMVVMPVIMIVAFFLKNCHLLGSIYLQNHILARLNLKTSSQLFRSYLHSSYNFSIGENTAQRIRNVSIVSGVFQGVLNPLILLISECMIVCAFLIILLIFDPKAALIVGGILVLAAYLFSRFLKKKLSSLGKEQIKHSAKMIKTINQSLGCLKETKILQKEPYFIKSFDDDVLKIVNASKYQGLWAQAPRFYFEIVVITSIMGLFIHSILSEALMADSIQFLTLYAVAAIRVMPSLSRIGSSINMIRFYIPTLDEVYQDVITSHKHDESVQFEQSHERKVYFEQRLDFEDVNFAYDGCQNVIEGLTITIHKNKMTAFIGPSGAGKTTIIDLICGLLEPTSGKTYIDGKEKSLNSPGWKQQLGYIPQSIYLLDDSVKNNIAFGVKPEDIDDEHVWECLRLAQMDQFITKKPDKLDWIVGEKGSRLSGGQQQRIGIARALYNNPNILVMDEATAALDATTEKNFMNDVALLSRKKTILLITHRESTLKKCDFIYKIAEGRLIEEKGSMPFNKSVQGWKEEIAPSPNG